MSMTSTFISPRSLSLVRYASLRRQAHHGLKGVLPGIKSIQCYSTTTAALKTTTTTTTPVHDIRLFDSLSETYKSLNSTSSSTHAIDGNDLEKAMAWYTCGPTTYAPAHLGHARTYVCLDIIRRVLEHYLKSMGKPPPLFVMNITDIDDKILAAAAEAEDQPSSSLAASTPLALARRFETEFWRDLDALHCQRPHVVTRVSEYVDSDIVPYIQQLCKTGMAYEAEDGVYFDLRGYEEKLGTITKYGKLAPPSAATDFFNLDGSHLNNDDASTTTTTTTSKTTKKDPRDFSLWKKRKEGEELYWESPWGPGRPGWHIECSAMIEAVSKQFSETHRFVVHAGGIDLKFPHHANEIAQAEAYHAADLKQNKSEWIPHWVHTGHLHIDGMKMSKSLKNFITIEELLQEDTPSALTSPADDFRLWCLGLSGSYRGSATYTKERIDEAKHVREKIVKFLFDGTEWMTKVGDAASKKWTNPDCELFANVNTSLEKAHAALMNDLDGHAFLRELVSVAETTSAYIRANPYGPPELMMHCLSSVRDRLLLVGFSDKTVRAGLLHDESGQHSQGIAGGERRLIEVLADFRTQIRNAALQGVKQGESSSESLSEILRLCDDARDTVLPSIGLELMDGDNEKSWRYCLPRSPDSESDAKIIEKPVMKSTVLTDVPLEDFFKLGQYEGVFSKYTDDGTPITNADGTEVSKRLLKKLLKKREKHQQRLETIQEADK